MRSIVRAGRLSAILAVLCVTACANIPRSQNETIIVSGASGQLGGLVVEELLAGGVDPRDLILVSRTPERLERYAAMGASTRFGDFTRPESLPEAYEGGDRMLLISIDIVGPDRPLLHKNAIDAAVAAGVAHIAYTSFVDLDNNDSPLAADHVVTERFLRESGVAWTMLRNSLYANSVVGQAVRMVEEGRVSVQPGATGVAYVTREDCAAAAAAVLMTPGHEFRAYDITGPAVVGTREIATIASEITGRPIQVVVGQGSGAGGGLSGPSFQVVSTAIADLTGRPATSIRQLLEAHREELLGQ